MGFQIAVLLFGRMAGLLFLSLEGKPGNVHVRRQE